MSPNYAWYFLALVPFIPLGAGAPAWALTLGAFLLYRPIFLPAQRSRLEDARHPAVPDRAGVHGVPHFSARKTGAPLMQLPGASAIVSVVIPCLNEEDAIPGVVREVLAQGVDEVIVVDNGSTDATAATCREAGRACRERAAPRLWPCLRGGTCRRASGCRDRVLPRRRRQRCSVVHAGRRRRRWRGARRISSWARACAATAKPAA